MNKRISLLLGKASSALSAKTTVMKLHSLKVLSRFNNLSAKKSNIYPYNVCMRSLASLPNNFNDVNKKNDTKEEEQPLTMGGKVKKMWKNYGAVAIGTYFCIYVSTLSSIFISLDYDLFNAATFGMDPIAAVEKVTYLFEEVTGSTALPAYIRENPRVGTFAIAWVMTKVTEPVRAAITVGVVPSVARWLGRAPPKEVKH